MKLYKALFIVCLAGVLASPLQATAADKTLKLSLSDAVTMARKNNYMVKAARSRVDQAEGRVVQTRQSSLPKVTLSETFLVTNDPGAALVLKLQHNTIEQADFMPSKLNNADVINDFHTSLQVTQPIYNADAAPGKNMALSTKTGMEFMASRTEETIGLQVSKIYYGLILARKNIEAVDQSIQTMQGYSAEASRGYSAGFLTKSDKLSTEVRLAELQEQKMMLQDAVKNATDMLRVMLNLDADVVVIPTGDFVVDTVVPNEGNSESLLKRSDIKAYEMFKQVNGYQEEMIRESRMPRLNAFLQSDLHGDALLNGGSSWSAGLNMQWNVFDGMATTGRLQEAKAKAHEATYNYEAAKSNSSVEVRTALRSLKTAKERIPIASTSLDAATTSLNYIGKQYKTGMAMTFELLMREQAWVYAKMRLNQAKYDYCVSRSELEYYKGN